MLVARKGSSGGQLGESLCQGVSATGEREQLGMLYRLRAPTSEVALVMTAGSMIPVQAISCKVSLCSLINVLTAWIATTSAVQGGRNL
jgi:hypothetical protein